MLLLVMWVLLGIRLCVLIALRALTEILRIVLAAYLLLRGVVLLVSIVIKLAVIILKATLTTLSIDTLPTCTAINDTW